MASRAMKAAVDKAVAKKAAKAPALRKATRMKSASSSDESSPSGSSGADEYDSDDDEDEDDKMFKKIFNKMKRKFPGTEEAAINVAFTPAKEMAEANMAAHEYKKHHPGVAAEVFAATIEGQDLQKAEQVYDAAIDHLFKGKYCAWKAALVDAIKTELMKMDAAAAAAPASKILSEADLHFPSTFGMKMDDEEGLLDFKIRRNVQIVADMRKVSGVKVFAYSSPGRGKSCLAAQLFHALTCAERAGSEGNAEGDTDEVTTSEAESDQEIAADVEVVPEFPEDSVTVDDVLAPTPTVFIQLRSYLVRLQVIIFDGSVCRKYKGDAAVAQLEGMTEQLSEYAAIVDVSLTPGLGPATDVKSWCSGCKRVYMFGSGNVNQNLLKSWGAQSELRRATWRGYFVRDFTRAEAIAHFGAKLDKCLVNDTEVQGMARAERHKYVFRFLRRHVGGNVRHFNDEAIGKHRDAMFRARASMSNPFLKSADNRNYLVKLKRRPGWTELPTDDHLLEEHTYPLRAVRPGLYMLRKMSDDLHKIFRQRNDLAFAFQEVFAWFLSGVLEDRSTWPGLHDVLRDDTRPIVGVSTRDAPNFDHIDSACLYQNAIGRFVAYAQSRRHKNFDKSKMSEAFAGLQDKADDAFAGRRVFVAHVENITNSVREFVNDNQPDSWVVAAVAVVSEKAGLKMSVYTRENDAAKVFSVPLAKLGGQEVMKKLADTAVKKAAAEKAAAAAKRQAAKKAAAPKEGR